FALAFIVFCLNRRWGVWFMSGALLNGLARVFVGVHWPSDIAGGIIVGLLSAFVITKLVPVFSDDVPKDITSNIQKQEVTN
ncbi:phosphatase PAP2 family protein, partial [Candidatus Jorgensenbacteria bacterium]|nr:phosphatase PAP2 family protein [Candidatus Jorgensenbacteria bacterium]